MTHRLTDHEIEELIGAYALDAVEDWERDQISAILEMNPRLRAELDAHRETVAYLAEGSLAAPHAPPAIWERMSADLDDAPPPLRLAPLAPLRSRRSRWTGYLTGAVAAAAAIVAIVFGLRVAQQDDRINELNAALSGQGVELAAATAVTAPGAEVVTLAAPEGVSGATAQIALGEDGIGYLLSHDLPALSADRTYQLWAIIDDRVISAGVLGPNPGVAPFQVAGNVAGFAITEEIAGGVVSSENPALSLWVRG